jgi:hypothetical protein
VIKALRARNYLKNFRGGTEAPAAEENRK